MKKIIIAFLLVLGFTAFAQSIKQGDVSVELTNGHNVYAITSPSKRYSVLYAVEYQNPEVALAYLDAEECGGSGRPGNHFNILNSPKGIVKVRHDWYSNTGYDRGHLISNDFFNFDEKLAEETFSVYNICPQLKSLNEGKGGYKAWRELEDATETQYANADGRVYVITGPILQDNVVYEKLTNSKNGKVYNCVIPKSFYKILLVQDTKNEESEGFKRLEVYIFKNEDIQCEKEDCLIITNKDMSIWQCLDWIETQLSLKITLDE